MRSENICYRPCFIYIVLMCGGGCLFVSLPTFTKKLLKFSIIFMEFGEMSVFCFLFEISVSSSCHVSVELTFNIIYFRTMDECFHLHLFVFIFSLTGGITFQVIFLLFMALLMLTFIQAAGGHFTVWVSMGAGAFMRFFITFVKMVI